jgi:hypothetical protein
MFSSHIETSQHMSTEFRMSKMHKNCINDVIRCSQIDTTGPRSPLWLFADCIGAISEIHQDLSLDPWIRRKLRFQQISTTYMIYRFTHDSHMIYIWFTYDLHMIYIWSTFQLPFLRRFSCLVSFFVFHLLVHITDIYNWYAELCWYALSNCPASTATFPLQVNTVKIVGLPSRGVTHLWISSQHQFTPSGLLPTIPGAYEV